MNHLSECQIREVYDIVSIRARRRPFRTIGPTRNEDDADEATHAVFLRLWSRAEKNWNAARGPLAAYIAASTVPELLKFRMRQRSNEIAQFDEEQVP